MNVDFTQHELKCIELALKTWIDTYYKKGSRAWQDKINILEKVRTLIEPEDDKHQTEIKGK